MMAQANVIRRCHDEAYLYIDQGLACDECGQTKQAVVLYQRGLTRIDDAMRTYDAMNPAEREAGLHTTSSTSCKSSEKSLAECMSKMAHTRDQIRVRINTITTSGSYAASAEQPPSYEESLSSPSTPQFAACNLGASSTAMMTDATLLFYIADGVQVFFIDNAGNVSAPSYPSSLGVYQFDGQQSGSGSTQHAGATFLVVNTWCYPLLPGRSPVLRSNWGAYVFPDVSTVDAGASVGVILPDSVDDVERSTFEQLMHKFTDLRQQPSSPTTEQASPRDSHYRTTADTAASTERRTSEHIASGIHTAADWIAWGLSKGAEKTGSLMKAGSSKVCQRLEPCTERARIDPRAQKGILYARKATDGAVKVSSFLVDKLGQATSALGRTVAPHIRRQGEKVLPASMTRRDSQNGQSIVDGVVEVAASGLQGFSTVYCGLEQAAKILAKSIAQETVTVVQHRYGDDAGQFTEHVMYTATNAAMTGHNLGNLGVKAVVKRAATDTGKAVFTDGAEKKTKS